MMSIDPSRLWKQVALGEDTDLELKAVEFRGGKVSAPRRDPLADEMAAFGNGGGGRVVLGVTDDRRPQSLDPSQLDALVSFVGEICTDSIKPPLDYSVFRVSAPEPASGGALVVAIPDGVTVHRSPGGYFRRRGDTKRQMNPAEIRQLSHTRGQSDAASTDTQVVRGTGINSLRRDLWRRYVSSRVDDPAQVALAKLKFVKDDSHGTLRATVGGVLLAAEDPREWLPNAWIQAVCYRGDLPDASRQVDAREIIGPLNEQIREALRFVLCNRRVAAYKDPARTDVPQFSERAVFEAVVNAVVHRDYAVAGSRIRLFMFDDRLELYSPGGLCNSMTTDDLRTSQFTRNELLASRLGQCGIGDVPGAGGRRYFIERRGEGIAVIEDETFALAGQRAIFELVGERELKVVPAGGTPAHGGGVRCLGGGHAIRHGRAASGRGRADALSQQDVSRGPDQRLGTHGVRAPHQAAHDRVVRRRGIHGARGTRLSTARAPRRPHAAGAGRGFADHRQPHGAFVGHSGAAEFDPGQPRSHVPLCGQRRDKRRSDSAGALRAERAGPPHGPARRLRNSVVSRDGGRFVRVRLSVRTNLSLSFSRCRALRSAAVEAGLLVGQSLLNPGRRAVPGGDVMAATCDAGG